MTSQDRADCPRFEDCSAPICPLQQNTIDDGIWYPDEDICTAKRFQTLPWVKKQKAITKAKDPEDRYFTVEMLGVIKQVRKGIEGISPGQPIEEATRAEKRWIAEKRDGRVIANKTAELSRVTRTKRSNLANMGEVSCQVKGGRKCRVE